MKINPEKEIIEELSLQLLVCARTAPKARGEDELVLALITEKEEMERIAQEMEKIAQRGEAYKFFKRDAENVRNSEALVLISLDFKKPVGVNCGACGFTCDTILKETKKELDYEGPVCAMRLIDLGIAIGSAVYKAKDLCIDNRVMYTIGVAAKKLGLLPGQVILGIPLSIKGKNIYFDRKF
ncbi:MAG: ferredoxin domain-containing protein [Caldimicrobium sp.]